MYQILPVQSDQFISAEGLPEGILWHSGNSSGNYSQLISNHLTNDMQLRESELPRFPYALRHCNQ